MPAVLAALLGPRTSIRRESSAIPAYAGRPPRGVTPREWPTVDHPRLV